MSTKCTKLPDHDNHHNALRCPYCNPRGLVLVDPAESEKGRALLREAADYLAELYALHQVRVGPFASQAQALNVRIGAFLRAGSKP